METMNDETKIRYTPAITKHWKLLHPKKCMILGTQNLNPGEELIGVISEIKSNQIIKGNNGREDEVTFLYLKDFPVPLCLNIGNSRIIASLYGDYYDKWIGKTIQIHAAEVKAVGGGKTMGLCIRKFIPNIEGDDISDYVDKINNAATMQELESAYLSAPKNVQPKLVKLTNERKKELS